MTTKFDNGQIMNGDYQGLYVLPLAVAMRDSSWDYASFIISLGIDIVTDIDADAMYVLDEHLPILADLFDIPDDERFDFLANFPRDWDT